MKTEINEVLKPVVRVNEGGSGLIVSHLGKTYVLTNAHVVENLVKETEDDDDDLKKVPFVSIDQFLYDKVGKLKGIYSVQGRLIAYDDVSDLAMIKLKSKLIKSCQINLPTKEFSKNVSVFDNIYIVGCSLARPAVPSQGIISSLNAEHDGQEYWMTTAPIVTGNSGGGCFKYDIETDKYILVGMPTAVSTYDSSEKDAAPLIIPHINYIIPAQTIIKFMNYVWELIS